MNACVNTGKRFKGFIRVNFILIQTMRGCLVSPDGGLLSLFIILLIFNNANIGAAIEFV